MKGCEVTYMLIESVMFDGNFQGGPRFSFIKRKKKERKVESENTNVSEKGDSLQTTEGFVFNC